MSDLAGPPWDELDLATPERELARMLAGEDSTMVLSSATYRGATLAVCRIPDSEWALVCLCRASDFVAGPVACGPDL